MTGEQLAALIRYKSNTNSTTFTDTDMLVLVNVFKDEISSLITERNQMYFAIPSTDSLIADQREYAFPSDMLNNLIKVEAKFASSDSRIPLTPVKDYRGSETESEIVKKYTNVEGEAAYLVRRRAIFILSGTIVAVTSGIRIWSVAYPANLANMTDTTELSIDPTTTTFGFPRQFHELLARRVGMERKAKTPGAKFTRLELNYEKNLQTQLDAIGHLDLGLEIIGELPPSGDLGDDGWNY